MAEKPAARSADLRATLDDITDLLMTIRRQQLDQEAYGLVTRLALAAALRTSPEAREAVATRLSAPAESLLGADIPPDSPLGKAVAAEARRLMAALTA